MELWTCQFLFKSRTNIHISPNFGNWEIRDPLCLLPTVVYPVLSRHIVFTREEWKTCFISFSPFILKGFRQQYLLWEWQQMWAVELYSCATWVFSGSFWLSSCRLMRSQKLHLRVQLKRQRKSLKSLPPAICYLSSKCARLVEQQVSQYWIWQLHRNLTVCGSGADTTGFCTEADTECITSLPTSLW